MADKRKLQGEIDRCLKKVSEGVETFDDIWQKVQTAANANQKEKYEADLKKEIKKLQRLRDQIKTWLTSNDIKDKKSLMENRKLIESRMERFKVIERETKTKAYSKEGLGLAAKVDPAQKEKEDIRQWLTDIIDQLERQIDLFESEIESLHSSSKKKKLDRDKQDRVDELTNWVERHKFHVQKSETIMRMLDNCSIETDDVKMIQDDLNYYVESNQEPDFAENELLYEDLNLDETAAITTGFPHFGPNDDDESSLASSPTSSGPLSPKTPTTNKGLAKEGFQLPKETSHEHVSAEIFEERRRGKTTSISSDHGNEVPPSPRRPGPKSLALNSNFPASRGGTNSSKTPNTPSAKNSSSSSSSSLSSLPPSNGNNSRTNVPPVHSTALVSPSPKGQKSTNSAHTQQQILQQQQQQQQSLLGSVAAYAVAAGGHNSLGTAESANNMPLDTTTSPDGLANDFSHVTSPSLSTPVSTTVTTTAHPNRSQGPPSLQSQHSRSSSTSSSLSPALTPSTDSMSHTHPIGVPPSLLEANVVSGPPSQPSISPDHSSLCVSVNTSPPNGSPPSQSSAKLSPVAATTITTAATHLQQLPVTMATMDSPSQYLPQVLPVKSTGLEGTETYEGSSLLSVGGSGMSISVGLMGKGMTDTSDMLYDTGLTGLSLAGDPPSVVTSFPLQTSDSFSPSSLGSFGLPIVGGTSVSSNVDVFGFASTSDSTAIDSMSSLKEITTEAILSHGLLDETKRATTDQNLRALLNPVMSAAPGTRIDAPLGLGTVRREASIQPLLGVAPLGPISLGQDKVYQLRMLESAFKHLPEPSDSEKVRPYLQRTPYPTPSYHHQHYPSHMESYDFYQRLSIETLFFIFYYMEGTKAQYMAAKALKKLSWRFHTKYMTWFQRLEEPNTITDDYEMGTYIYFDYEKWAQRKKDGFTFEYRYLEDRDLP